MCKKCMINTCALLVVRKSKDGMLLSGLSMQLALFFKGAGEKCDEDPRRRIVEEHTALIIFFFFRHLCRRPLVQAE